jgi:phage anti-repressor protein
MSNSSTAVSNVIPVFQGRITSEQEHLVDARNLHGFLEVGRDFSSWIKGRIEQYGFIEGEDFSPVVGKSSGGRPSIEYHLTLDMAKELAMVENNKKGKQARRYFIACEKALRAKDKESADNILHATIGTDGFHMLGAVIKGKVVGLPKSAQRRATMKIWAQTHVAFGVRSAADIPADKLDAARNFIAAYVLEGEYLPKSEHGMLESMTRRDRCLVYFDSEGKKQIKPVPYDAAVMKPSDLIRAIVASPGDMPVSTDEMFGLVIAAIENLKSRHEYQALELKQAKARNVA